MAPAEMVVRRCPYTWLLMCLVLSSCAFFKEVTSQETTTNANNQTTSTQPVPMDNSSTSTLTPNNSSTGNNSSNNNTTTTTTNSTTTANDTTTTNSTTTANDTTTTNSTTTANDTTTTNSTTTANDTTTTNSTTAANDTTTTNSTASPTTTPIPLTTEPIPSNVGMWPTNMSGIYGGGDVTIYTKHTSVPFPYFSRVVDSISILSLGYVTFGADIQLSSAPVGTGWPEYPSIFGVYWAPILTPVDRQSYLNVIEETGRLKTLNFTSPLIDYIKRVVNESSFEPIYITVTTWGNVIPKPPRNFTINDKATFQLILATDSEFSYAIKSYEMVWRDAVTTINGRSLVSADYSGVNGSRISADVPKSPSGPILVKLFSSGTPSKNPFDCVKEALAVKSRLSDAIKTLPVCPCYLTQVSRNRWFEAQNSSSCFQSISFLGVQRQCCYNRLGLVIRNMTENDLPFQVNATNDTIQSVFNQCLTTAPQLTKWFLEQFPSSSCSGYNTPSTAGVIGGMHIVMFAGSKYTFNGLGDFVLLRNGNFEMQARTRRIDNSNITTLEAIAIKVEGITTRFQLYWQPSVQMWNISLIHGNTTAVEPYKKIQSQSNITLIFPKFIVTATSISNISGCTVQTNTWTPDTVGLLGSINGSDYKNFAFRNGTIIMTPLELLNGEIIRDFVQSWKVLNEAESMINYTGARSYAEANNNTGFIPMVFATTVNDTLKMFNDTNKKTNAYQLCGEELLCLQDYYLNAKNVSATEVLWQTKNISLQKEESIVTPPKFIGMPGTLLFNITSVQSYPIKNYLANATSLTFSMDSSDFQGISEISLDQGIFAWNLNASLASLRQLTYPRRLKFYVTNSLNLSIEHVPTINLCLCGQDSHCVNVPSAELNNDEIGFGNVNNMLCYCGAKSGGKFCDQTVDFCGNCYNKSTCDRNVVNYCTSCPKGYEGDGIICDDVNECSTNNGGCDHICTNNNGSFECSCEPGYRKNETDCFDIDECQQNQTICDGIQNTHCVNGNGSYSCVCYPNMVGQEKCIRAPFKFFGSIELADVVNQEWSTNLTNRASAEFKTLATNVIQSITAALTNGSGLTKDNIFIEVVAFEEVQNAARTKRQAVASNSHIAVKYVIYLTDDTVTADKLNKLLSEFSTACNQSCPYGKIILYSKPPQVDANANLCNFPQIHKCDELTSNCTQLQQTTNCVCKPGYEYSADSFSCRDKNECAGNVSQICPETGVCMNTAGTYKCNCSAGQFWDVASTKCVVDGCSTKPCKNNGVCFTLYNPEQFACKCGHGWEGTLCDSEDAEAKRMEIAVICVSVILGVFCLVLLIILIIMCCKYYRNGSDWTLENDSYINSRYNDGDHLPRAKITNRQGTEMAENGQDSGYQRLNYGQPADKQTTFGNHSPTPNSKNEGKRNVYDNRAYEGEGGERL